MLMTEDNIVEVSFDKEHLLGIIFSPSNFNRAYKAVVRNNGSGGIDKMWFEQLFPWLKCNKDELISFLEDVNSIWQNDFFILFIFVVLRLETQYHLFSELAFKMLGFLMNSHIGTFEIFIRSWNVSMASLITSNDNTFGIC